jgi:hypothetical protein
VLGPFRFLLIAVSGWMNHRQLQVIEYLREENWVLREQLGGRRVRFNDDHHQGLKNQLISPEAGHRRRAGEIQRRQRLGGMLNYYYRAAV